jgi:hypothetical protein
MCRVLAPKVTTGTQAPITVGKWFTIRKYIVQRSCSHLMLNTLARAHRSTVFLNHSPCISDPRVMCRALAPKVTTGTQAPIPVGKWIAGTLRKYIVPRSCSHLMLNTLARAHRSTVLLNHSPCISDPQAMCRALAPKLTTGTQAPIPVGKWVTISLRKYIVQRSCSRLMLSTLAPIHRLCVLNHSPCISDDPRVMCRALAPKVTTGTQAPVPVGKRIARTIRKYIVQRSCSHLMLNTLARAHRSTVF